MSSLPPLGLLQWRASQCQTLMKHIQMLLQDILQDAVYVKKLDFPSILSNQSHTEVEEKNTHELLRVTAGKLRTIKEISVVISQIDSGDRAHNSAQHEISSFVDTLVSSTVKMLRAVLNIFARKTPPEQFETEFQPFLLDVRQLIQLLPKLHWNTGPEIFTRLQ
eukprot:TRINITY_DN370_c0_g3_i1.p1 TRINITY_DN370_c0_g3~~TRINITY_DN370_c0_g3_i1.p1  ORF type:complete len:187 (-),score=35.42 TRINITY_DN370_c0_g3_i1:17-508(-)